jgi:hypothetical protein
VPQNPLDHILLPTLDEADDHPDVHLCRGCVGSLRPGSPAR